MEEYRSNLKYVGKVNLEKATELVLSGKGRFGRGVSSASAAKAIADAKSEHVQIVADKLKLNSTALLEKTPDATRVKLKNQREILTILQQAGSRKLHTTELAAILAFRYGFTSELQDKLNAANRLQLNSTRELIQGSITDILKSNRAGNMKKAHDYLLKNKKVVPAIDLEKELNAKDISIALGVMDLMGLVRKLPINAQKSYPYIHEEHALNPETKHLTLPHWNTDYLLLKQMQKLGGTASQKTLTLDKTGRIIAKSNDEGSTNIRIQIARLKHVGLLEEQKQGASHMLSLTAHAVTLLRDSEHELSESFRLHLLGQAKEEKELNPNAQRIYERVVKWLTIVTHLSKLPPRDKPYLHISELARKLNVPNTAINTVIEGRTPFGHNLSQDKINKIYLPKLRKEHPELADTLEQYLTAKTLGEGLTNLSKK